MIEVKSFGSMEDLSLAMQDMLVENFQTSFPEPHAVMLSGGRTPLEIYNRIAESGVKGSAGLHIFLSDERMVSLDSSDNNYANIEGMISALGVAPPRAIRVDTSLGDAGATEKFHADLATFLDGGGRIRLGVLGMGNDGHTASLFEKPHVAMGEGRYAISISKPEPPDRISVTKTLLNRVERIVFLVAGAEKVEMIARLLNEPTSIPAGLAVQGRGNVELWTYA